MTQPTPQRNNRAIFILLALAAVLAVAYLVHRGPLAHSGLVVYCALDSAYSEPILRKFEKDTGIPLTIRYDAKATQGPNLEELLTTQKDSPQCDVFWNSGVLGTIDLADRGILEPYPGAGWQRIPAAFKDPSGRWAGFAGRLRVWIYNTNALGKNPPNIDELTSGPDLFRVAVAKPLSGSSLAHYTLLWQALGERGAKDWHDDWHHRGVSEVATNAIVKEVVAMGVCDLGLTDSDDFFQALDAGKPVGMVPATIGTRSRGARTILIPNTAAIIHGTPRLPQAQKLVDYLLSEETELTLANSKSRQIPLGPVDQAKLNPQVRQLQQAGRSAADLSNLAASHAACLTWLKSLYPH